LEIDNALLRRLRVITFQPDVDQLEEMLKGSEKLGSKSSAAERDIPGLPKANPNEFTYQMPFGHGIFAGVMQKGRICTSCGSNASAHAYRPLARPHPFAERLEIFTHGEIRISR